MSQPFNPNTGLVVVPAAIHGPAGIARLALAVDTGATGTLINAGPLMSAAMTQPFLPSGYRSPPAVR